MLVKFHFLLVLLAMLLTVSLAEREYDVLYWHLGIHDEHTVLQQTADDFYQKSGIRVKVQPIPWGNYQTKYLTAMASGDPPDAATTSLSGPMDYGKVGGLIDLEKNFPDAIARLKERIFSDMWPTCYFNNRLYGIPYDAAALIGFYRKDIFRNLNLEPPETWSELVRLLENLTANNYQYAFVWTRNAHWGIGTYIWPYGVETYDYDGKTATWTRPGFIKGFKYAINLWNTYNMAIEKPVEIFSIDDDSKATPLFFDYVFRYTELFVRAPQLKDKIGIFPFPKADGGLPGTIMGGRTLVIFRKGKNHDLSMQWLEFLMSKQNELKRFHYLAGMGERAQLALSVVKDFWNEDLQMQANHQQVFHEVYKRLKTKPGFPWTKEAERLLEQSFFSMGDILQSYFRDLANKYNMSVWDIKKAFAAGNMPDEKQRYYEYFDRKSRNLLNEITSLAQEKLDTDRSVYTRYYGNLLDRIGEQEKGWDVLDYAKLIVAIIIILFIVIIAVNPDLRRNWLSYVYISPAVIAALIFVCIPIVVSLYLSFTKYNPVMPLQNAKWVGLDNYMQIFQDKVLWQSLGRSLYFAVLVLPIQIIMAVILAACLDKNLYPDRLYKFLYFSPLVTSIISVSLIWYALYAGTEYGWLNSLLLNMNFIKDPIIFLYDRQIFLDAVIIMSIWQGLAFAILIFLAGFQNIPKTMYEAASIDGAGPFRQFLRISLPGLKPQLTFLVIMGTIGSVQVFEQIFMLGGGTGQPESKFGPADSGMTIVPFLYRKGFEFFKMGEASAIAYILFVILFTLTFINLKFILKNREG
jgi:multiple sugar transport system permease protein